MGPGQRRIEPETQVPSGTEKSRSGPSRPANLVLFCNWPVEDRFRLVRPRRLPQLPLRCSQLKPRVPGQARLKLMCKFADEPDSAAFPIGAGCTNTFARSGELVVFANDRLRGYADNRGAVTLAARLAASRRGRPTPSAASPRDGAILSTSTVARRRPGHRRARHRRLGNPALHAPGTRSRARRWRGWIGRLGHRLRDRAPVLRVSGLELVAHRHRLELRTPPPALAAPLAPRMGAEGAGLRALRGGRSRAPHQFQVERLGRLGAAGDRRDLPRVSRLPGADNAASRGTYATRRRGFSATGSSPASQWRLSRWWPPILWPAGSASISARRRSSFSASASSFR